MRLCCIRSLRGAVVSAPFFLLLAWFCLRPSTSGPLLLPLSQVLKLPSSFSTDTPWPYEGCPYSYTDDEDGPPPREYSSVVIRPRFTKTERPSLSSLPFPLIPPFVQTKGNQEELFTSQSCRGERVTILDLNPDPPINRTNHILFGVATTASRLNHSISSLLFYISPLKANLVAIVPPEDASPATQAYFHSISPSITLLPSPLEYTQRYFSLVLGLSGHLMPETTHAIFLDDDTFISSPFQLASRLAQLSTSSNTLQCIGAKSESTWQLYRHGHHFYGGASIILSRQLLLVLNASYPSCSHRPIGPHSSIPGDQHLASCIAHAAPNATFEEWPELHQCDLRGNPDGLFESGRPIWSLHHWTGATGGWMDFRDVVQMASVNAAAGEDAFLRRWIFGVEETASRTASPPFDAFGTAIEGALNRDIRSFWVFTNGYSFVEYTISPNTPVAAKLDLGRIQHSWKGSRLWYEGSLGPLRKNDESMRGLGVRRWRMRKTWVDDKGAVHQTYVDGEGEGEKIREENRSMIEVIWLVNEGLDLEEIFRTS